MPSIRPDQLPSGQNFNFDDIMLIETNPHNSNRKLNQISIRDFCKTASLFDPAQGNANFLLGLQSQFEWMFAQMNEMAKPNSGPVVPFSEFQSNNPNLPDIAGVSPTPTPSITVTPTPTITPNIPPSATPTPTPTPAAPTLRKVLDLNGPLSSKIISLPSDYRPSTLGYTTFQIIENPNFDQDLLSDFFHGTMPNSFSQSSVGELLNTCIKADTDNKIVVEVFIDNDAGGRVEALMDQSSISLTLEYSN